MPILMMDFAMLANHENLRQLLLIRSLLLCAQIITVLWAYFFMPQQVSYTAMVALFIVMIAGTVYSWQALSRPHMASQQATFIQLLADIAALTWFLYFSGGATNPFVSYYLVPISIAAATMCWSYTGLLAMCCISAYSLLLFFYHPLDLFDMNQHQHHGSRLNPHIVGMWLNFVLSALLITYFVVKMASRLNEREMLLQAYREQNLQNEKMLAIATQAAGTAHELGTPLGTIAITLDNIADNPNEDLPQQLETVQQQVAICRNALQKLVATASERAQNSGYIIATEDYLEDLLDLWILIRPDANLNVHWENQESRDCLLQTTPALDQAILNLLNNAADASPEKIDLHLQTDSVHLTIQIIDQGPGIPAKIADQLGQAFTSSKAQGLGLGLYLSHATLNKMHGRVKLYNRQSGGTLTEITLPVLEEQHDS